MCLAIPARVISLDSHADTAQVDLSGIHKEISTALIEDVSPGDYVLIHVGFALQKLDAEEAERTLALFDELEIMNELEAVKEAGEAR